MKTIRLLVLCCAVLTLGACVKSTSSYKKLQAQYDSLELASKHSAEDLDEMLSIINDIEQNFTEIREAQNFVTIKRKGGELSATTRQEIKNNLSVIANTLKKNREQLALLNDQVKNNSIKSKSLIARIARYTKELQQKESELTTLRDELAKKDLRISELDSLNADLSQNVENLAAITRQQNQKIKQQEDALHTAYYCFGSVSELKEQKILAGGGLFSSLKVLPAGFNKDYFLPIDTREATLISLFAKKARVRTNHPTGSYEFVKDAEGNMVLQITNKKAFWENTRYLVIEVTP